MNKIKTWEDFKKLTPIELFEYSNREDLTDEDGELFISFCNRALEEPNNDFITESNETLKHYFKRKIKEENE